MKKFFIQSLFLLLFAVCATGVANAQGATRGRIEAARDTLMENTAKHNLQVARFNLERRKAYEGARSRLQEIIDTYPEFSRMDEVLYLMGEVHLKLKKNDEAIEYFRRALKEFPESEHAKKVRQRLKELNAAPEEEPKTGER